MNERNVLKYIDLVKKLVKEKFYGKLILQFENGRIVIAKLIKSIKL